VLPHPAAALVSALGVMPNVMLVVTPVMATCTVELQVFAVTELVLVVKVVLATLTTAPAAVGVAAGRFATGTRPLLSCRQSLPVVPAVHWAALTIRESLPCAAVPLVVPKPGNDVGTVV
jgi:hypothetical protein